MKYKVTYEIEVDAETHREAALEVEDTLKNGSYRPFLTVTDDNNKTENIDLDTISVKEDEKEFNHEEFEKWFEKYRHDDGVQRHYRGVIEQNPDYELCFKDWAKKYFQECVDI